MAPSSIAWVRSLLKTSPLSSTTTPRSIALGEAVEDLDLARHLLLAAEDAEVLEHRVAEVVADLPRPLALAHVEQRLQLALGVAPRARAEPRPSCATSACSAAARPDAAAERDRLHQRVAAEAVRAVHRHARDLARGVEAGQLGERRRCRSRRRPCGSGRRAGRAPGRRSGRRPRTSSTARASRAGAR